MNEKYAYASAYMRKQMINACLRSQNYWEQKKTRDINKCGLISCVLFKNERAIKIFVRKWPCVYLIASRQKYCCQLHYGKRRLCRR